MILYLSVPYSIKSKESIEKAALAAQKAAGQMFSYRDEISTPVSGIFSWYKNPDLLGEMKEERDVYPFSKPLVDAAKAVVVVREPGWDYSDIVQQEASYAYHTNKPIIYIDL